ncbi:SIS domain-containing protein [Patescibacteria group bacterium]|nr:SIS domain-containing protein [Patescibacteria group bacterium]
MSGLIAAISGESVLPSLLVGLQHMSIRGNDGAGIALVGPDRFVVRRVAAAHAVEGLITGLAAESLPVATTGMAHVRWATRGGVSTNNAHPHRDPSQRFAIVHNGTIDVACAIRLQRDCLQGVTLSSETDTEIIVSAWAVYVARAEEQGASVDQQLMTRFLMQIEGDNAFVIVDYTRPKELFVFLKGITELYVGLSEQGYLFVSSVLMSLQGLVQEPRRLAAGGYIFQPGAEVLQGTIRSFYPLEDDLDVGAHSHAVLRELHETTAVLERIIQTDEQSPLMQYSGQYFTSGQVDEIVMVACGSSLHATHLMCGLFESLLRVPVTVVDATNTVSQPPRLYGAHSIVIAVSASGHTLDTLEGFLKCAPPGKVSDSWIKGLHTIGIHNDRMSPLAAQVTWPIFIHAGVEKAVSATKSFFAQCATMMLLAQALQKDSRSGDEKDMHLEIRALARLLKRVKDMQASLRSVAAQLARTRHLLVLGTGTDLAAACEGAFKFREMAYLPVFAESAGEFKHASLTLVPDRAQIIVLAPKLSLDSPRYNHLVATIDEILARGGRPFIITTQGNDDFDTLDATVLKLPRSDTPLQHSLVTTYALQFLAYFCGEMLGHDVDAPRHLTKEMLVP